MRCLSLSTGEKVIPERNAEIRYRHTHTTVLLLIRCTGKHRLACTLLIERFSKVSIKLSWMTRLGKDISGELLGYRFFETKPSIFTVLNSNQSSIGNLLRLFISTKAKINQILPKIQKKTTLNNSNFQIRIFFPFSLNKCLNPYYDFQIYDLTTSLSFRVLT